MRKGFHALYFLIRLYFHAQTPRPVRQHRRDLSRVLIIGIQPAVFLADSNACLREKAQHRLLLCAGAIGKITAPVSGCSQLPSQTCVFFQKQHRKRLCSPLRLDCRRQTCRAAADDSNVPDFFHLLNFLFRILTRSSLSPHALRAHARSMPGKPACDAAYLSAASACASAVSSEAALSAASVPGFGATVISISSSGVASMTRTSAFASLTALMASFAAA